GFILMDFSTGMIFDFISTGQKIGAIYERLLIPGVTDEKTAFTYLIEAPFSGIRTEPGKLHQYSIRIDASKRRAEWFADGKTFFKAEGVPVEPKEIMIGWGLFTLNPVDPVKGSVSIHGQGEAISITQYLHWGATERNENGVFIGMNEPKSRLVTEMRDLGMDLASLEKKRQFGYVDATEVRRIPEQARVGRIPVGGKELG